MPGKCIAKINYFIPYAKNVNAEQHIQNKNNNVICTVAGGKASGINPKNTIDHNSFPKLSSPTYRLHRCHRNCVKCHRSHAQWIYCVLATAFCFATKRFFAELWRCWPFIQFSLKRLSCGWPVSNANIPRLSKATWVSSKNFIDVCRRCKVAPQQYRRILCKAPL